MEKQTDERLFVFNLQLFAEDGEDHGDDFYDADDNGPEFNDRGDYPEDFDGSETGPEDQDDAGDDADQHKDDSEKRTSKQPPEFDAVAAELRRERERLADLERSRQTEKQRRDAEISQLYGASHGIHTEEQYWAAVKAQQDQQTQQNKYIQIAQQMKADGYDDVVIQTRIEAMMIKDELTQTKMQLQTDVQRRQKEEQERRSQQEAQKLWGEWFDQYKNLRKDYPDLLPKDATSFVDLVPKLDKQIIDRMSRGLSLEEAFKLTNMQQVAAREAQRNADKQKANADRGTSSGRGGGGDAQGGYHGLTADEIALVRDMNRRNPEIKMTYKEFAQRKQRRG